MFRLFARRFATAAASVPMTPAPAPATIVKVCTPLLAPDTPWRFEPYRASFVIVDKPMDQCFMRYRTNLQPCEEHMTLVVPSKLKSGDSVFATMTSRKSRWGWHQLAVEKILHARDFEAYWEKRIEELKEPLSDREGLYADEWRVTNLESPFMLHRERVKDAKNEPVYWDMKARHFLIKDIKAAQKKLDDATETTENARRRIDELQCELSLFSKL